MYNYWQIVQVVSQLGRQDSSPITSTTLPPSSTGTVHSFDEISRQSSHAPLSILAHPPSRSPIQTLPTCPTDGALLRPSDPLTPSKAGISFYGISNSLSNSHPDQWSSFHLQLFGTPIAIQKGDERYSFTQYTAGGLFWWVDHGFQKESEYWDSLLEDVRIEEEEVMQHCWTIGLGIFSTLDKLKSMSE